MLLAFIIFTVGYFIEHKGPIHLLGLNGFFYFLGRLHEEKDNKF